MTKDHSNIPANIPAKPAQIDSLAFRLSIHFMAERGIEATPANRNKFKHRMLATLLNYHNGASNITHGMIQQYFAKFTYRKISKGVYKPTGKTKVPADIAKLVKVDETADEAAEEKPVKVKATRKKTASKKATSKKAATVKAVFDDMKTVNSDQLTDDQKADMLAMLQAKIDALLA
jgi:hypothetical protein